MISSMSLEAISAKAQRQGKADSDEDHKHPKLMGPLDPLKLERCTLKIFLGVHPGPKLNKILV